MSKGQHLICDLSGVPEKTCSDDKFLLNVGKRIAGMLGVEILHSFKYNFFETKYPDGCSVICVLSGSHIAFHTFAEDGSIAVDVFCCNRDNWQDSVLKILRDEINPSGLTWHTENRFEKASYFMVTNEELIEQHEERVDDSVLIISPTLHNDLGSFLDVVASNVVERGIKYTYIYPIYEHHLYTELLHTLRSKIRQKFPRKRKLEEKVTKYVEGLGLPDLIYPIPWEMGVYYYKDKTKIGFMEHPNYPQYNFIFPDEPRTKSFHRLISRLRESSTRSIEYTGREICDILNRFDVASLSVTRRKTNPFPITEEEDVKDLLHTILVAKFANVEREFYIRGKATNRKVDFYFSGLGIALEVKSTVSPHRMAGKILEEIKAWKDDLTVDDKVKVFIGFIYAPGSEILQRKEEIIREIQSSTDELETIIIINP